jgi:pimeloyl-ACP methyl ester carboxylesterase
VGGLVDEWIALSLPWGFDLAEVTVPVVVWHGELDDMVRPAHGRFFSTVLPNARLVLYPQEGHLLLLEHWDEILAAVTTRAKSNGPAGGRHEPGGQAAPQ